MRAVAVSFLSFLLAAALSSEARAAPEVRGLWVVRTALVSPEAVDHVVDEARDAGFNALFVQVRGRGDAFYASKLVSRSSLLWKQPASFDPLERLLLRARANGMEVHAWVNVLLTAHFGQPLPPGHILRTHPDWIMVPRALAGAAARTKPAALYDLVGQNREVGEAEGYYLSPFAPGVAQHLEGMVDELLRAYPVDGLHLDFIRFPGPEFDWSRHAIRAWQERHAGPSPLAFRGREPEAWFDLRREAVGSLARQLVQVARRVRPAVVVSAAVVPDLTQAAVHKGQDWPAWLAGGLLDAVCPMAYTPDSRVFRTQVEAAREKLGPKQALWAGIGAYRLTVPGMVEKIQLARASGASGVVLFSHESLADGDARRLREEAFPPAVAGVLAPEEGAGGQ